MTALKSSVAAGFVAAVMFTALNAAGQVAAQQEKQVFDRVTAKLDRGGTYYSFQNNKYFYENVRKWFDSIQKGILASELKGIKPMQVAMFSQGIRMLVPALGINELQAYGASSILIDEGGKNSDRQFRNKVYFYHGKNKPNGLLWQLAGERNERFNLKFLPKNTIYAGIGQFHPAKIWVWAKKEVPQLFPPALMIINTAEVKFQQRFNLPLEQLLNKLGGTWTIVITYEKDASGKPFMRGVMIVPVTDGVPFDLLAGNMKDKNIKVDLQRREINMDTGKTAPVEVREMLRPQIKEEGKLLYLASSPEILLQLKHAETSGNGLTAMPEFNRYARGLDFNGVQFTYLSSAFMDDLVETISFHSRNKQSAAIISCMFSVMSPSAMISVISLDDEGVMVNTNSGFDLASSGGAQANIATTSVLAGMLLPALSQAREKACRIRCVSNLKSIGLALKQYAADHNGQFPPGDNTAGLNELISKGYLADPGVYICPSAESRKAVLPGRPLTEAGCSYIYLGGQIEGPSPDAPLAFDKPENHNGYINVLFKSGHVAGFSRTGLTNCEKTVRSLAGKLQSAEAEQLLNKAREIDRKMGYK
ncbi:MAG: DUF1559 domain-containing protein [Victivallaceae bacterium]|nr:DUF1559 domain-containing protein [Victivallaceae bacterium]